MCYCVRDECVCVCMEFQVFQKSHVIVKIMARCKVSICVCQSDVLL